MDQLIVLKHLYGNTLTVLLLRTVTKESTPSPQSLFPRDCASAAATYTEALPMCDKASLNIAKFRSDGSLLARIPYPCSFYLGVVLDMLYLPPKSFTQ